METLLFILMAALCFVLSSAIHELGHVLMGLNEGFNFYLFVAGPFGLKRDANDKVVFYIEKNAALWGGVGATVPLNTNADNYKKFGRVLLGGPIASLVFGAIWLPLGLVTKNMLFLLLGTMPISMGMVSLIPLRNGAFYTDGGRWLRMHKNERTKAVEVALWNLTQQAIVQGNYANINFDEILVLINDEDVRTKYVGHYYAYYFYKDNHDSSNKEKEKEELEKLSERVPKQMVSMFAVD